jgi:hypothetical protein
VAKGPLRPPKAEVASDAPPRHEYQNDVVLRDLAQAYLTNSDPHSTDAQEHQGRQIASLAHFAFTEHTVITHRIAMELGV